MILSHRRRDYKFAPRPPQTSNTGRYIPMKLPRDLITGETLLSFRQRIQVVRVTTAWKAINTVYTLHGQILEVVTSAKYLGVDISSGLSWNSNINRITGNANRTLGYIRRNIKSKNQKVRETAYNTLVRPQLEYGALFGILTLRKKHFSLKKF